MGIEPTACGLRNRCSTAELRWLVQSMKPCELYWRRGPEPFDTTIDTNARHIPGQRAAATLSLASF